MIFLLLFAFSLISYRIALSQKGFLQILSLVIIIVASSLLAGLRNEDVGADTAGYVINTWKQAGYQKDLYEFFLQNGNEFGYVAFNYWLSKISSDFHFYMFIHQALIISIYILASLRLKNRTASFLLMMAYYLYVYNSTYNYARQSIALAFVVYAMTFLIENKYWKYFLWTMVALLFHNSVVFAFLLPLLKFLLEKVRLNFKLLLLLSTVSIIFVVIFYQTVLSSLIGWGMMSDRYEHYIDQEGYRTHKADIVMVAGFLLITFYHYKKKKGRTLLLKYSLLLLTYSLGFLLMGDIVEVANRVVYYFCLSAIMCAPLSFAENKKLKNLVIGYFFFLIFFALFRVFSKYGLEYHSDYLGI